MMLNRNRGALTLATAVASMALIAPTAQAAPPITLDPEVWDDFFSFTCDAGTGDSSGDFTATEHHVGQSLVTLKNRKPVEGFWFGTVRGWDEGTYEASFPDGTRVSWSGRNEWIEKDRRILSVEGTIATVLIGTTFHSTMYAPDGSVDGKNNGMFQFTFEIDLATGEGNFGEAIKDVGHRGSTGTLCGDAERFAQG